ncbi:MULTISPECIES: LysR substrate-binding domain-containing protein [Halomonadaceae]|uniref:LysR substrate-binding domain-containing protein n=1 Tax=Halomonadaceae TaxID=28256 RepID=UPI00158175EF|nr:MULTISPECIES: LysR substrate-binding domain-containing protein [Halomonas]MDI4636103.1 LysR substrate-binding domain-containing protein [Halomonas sp. BMC7]NUJ60469.1 LysR family transcriptional regulator [Halomonas taeanensis]
MSSSSRLPLAALQAFEAAARHGSFSVAADELHVTAAAVSHRIKALEESLALRLFERKARGVVLTEAGVRYQARIAEAFTLIDRATRELSQPSVDGPLWVSAPQAFLQHALMPRVGELLRRHPGLDLTLIGDNRMADLRAGKVDVAIRFGNGDYPGLSVVPLLDDAITVLAPAHGDGEHEDWRHTCFIEDASALPTEPWSHWHPWWREAGLHAPQELRRLKVSDSGLALAACREGLGLCLSRLSVAQEAIDHGEVIALRPWRRTEFSYYLVSLPGAADTPRLVAFRDWLEETLHDLRQAMRAAIRQPAA